MLTHIDEKNNPKMVNINDKNISFRKAKASGKIFMNEEAFKAICENTGKKGPVIQSAVIAAIMGAKKTSELIPMCHPLMLSSISCDIKELENKNGFELIVSVSLEGKTGVEMEALTGVSIGLLCIYDMIKAIDKKMEISNIVLLEKSGGKNGEFIR